MPPQPISKKRARPPTMRIPPGNDAASAPQRRRLASSSHQTQQRRQVQSQILAPLHRYSEDEDEEEGEEEEEEENGRDQGEITIDRLSKKLVRLALASEYTRQPIRRTDITNKILTPANSRLFKPVFASAQSSLHAIFGMTLTELPMRDKLTLTQKRSALRSQKPASTNSKSYILTTLLPPAFRVPEILSAGTTSTNTKEEAYVALTTTICSLVYLNGRSINEAKLDRHLRRLNIEQTTPVDRTEKLLSTMCKQGYLLRVKDNTGGDTSWEYHLGPRAKMEIGKEGVVSLVKKVYGVQAPEDVEERVGRNIGIEEVSTATKAKGRAEGGGGTQGESGRREEDNGDDDEEEGDDSE
ncbi:MAGE family-domain-containing protein [Tirmania nivea]|nr:MAGE family-domain-containing protein [Tirmania nivea]